MISQRIGEVADYLGIRISSLEKKIGASDGVLRRSIRNNTDIQSKWLSKISDNYPKINPAWLLTGRGEMLLKTENMVERPQGTYMKAERSIMKPTYDPSDPPVFQASKDEGFIPYYDMEATASDLSMYEDYSVQPEGYIKFPGIEECDFALPVYGKSMEPEINQGDYVAVKRITDFSFFNYGVKYLIVTHEQRMIKYIHPHEDEDYLILRSANPSHQDIKMPRQSILQVFLILFVFKREM